MIEIPILILLLLANIAVIVLIVVFGGEIGYLLLTALLKILDLMNQGFDVLLGVKPVLLNGEAMSINEVFFNQSTISMVFWGITLIGLVLATVFSIIEIGRRATNLIAEKTMGMTLGKIGRSMLMFFVTPLLFLSVLQILTVSIKKIDEVFYIANGNISIDTALFAMAAQEAALEDPDVIDKFADGTLRYHNVKEVSDNLDIDSINVWVTIPVVILLVIMYGICMIILTWRLFVLIMLYLVSPFFVSSMVLDDGVKYKAWRKTFFAKLISGFTLLIAVKIFTFLFVPILRSDIAFADNILADFALKCLMLFGTSYAMYKSTNVVISIIAPGMESDETAFMKKTVGATVGKIRQLPAKAVKFALTLGKKAIEIGVAVAAIAVQAALAIPTAGATGASAIGTAGAGAAKIVGKEGVKVAAKVGKKAVQEGAKVAKEVAGKAVDTAKDVAGSAVDSVKNNSEE